MSTNWRIITNLIELKSHECKRKREREELITGEGREEQN